MSDKQYEEVPSELQTHKPSEQVVPTTVTPSALSGTEVPENLISNERPEYKREKSPYTTNQAGLIVGGGAAGAAITGQKTKMLYDVLDSKSAHPGVQNYINSQLGAKFDMPAKELSRLSNIPVENSKQAWEAIKKISAAEATPDAFKEIYKVDPATGKTVLSHVEKTPGSPAKPGLYDPKDYVKTPSYHLKKHTGLPLRSALAGYDIGSGMQQITNGEGVGDIAAGTGSIGAGVLAGAAPFLPKKVRAVATGLGLAPVGAQMIGSATAADLPGTAFDLATGFMGPIGMALAPSQLGDATLNPKRDLLPGQSVLEGTRLYPQKRANGGSISMPEMAREIMQHHLNYRKGGDVKPKHKPKYTINTLPDGLSKEEFAHLLNGGHIDISEHLAEGGEPKKFPPA